ncbi:MAG: RNA polymerase sigma factor [Roseibium sp.]|nr:RNA polymerase sigma factor [Roseibium sp.]
MPTAAANACEGLWKSWNEDRTDLKRMSLRLTRGDRTSAEDLVSATLVKATSHAARHRAPIRDPKAFLLTVMWSEHIDRQRKRIRDKGVLNRHPDPTGGVIGDSADPRPGPDRQAADRDTVRKVLKHVKSLPADLQTVFRLRFIEDHTYREIAWHMAISEPLTRKHVQCLRAHLREALKD